MAEQTINWQGQSGTTYTYWIYSADKTFTKEPGNYIFSKQAQDGKHSPVYIGQTGDLSERFDNHHKMPCIKRNGATHICVHKSSTSEQDRLNEEVDLLRKWNTVCNV